MTRSRIKYELIPNERTRKETFKKRKRGLFKKLNELQVLCNIDICGIVMNDNGTMPEVWPSLHDVNRVIQRFKDLPSSSKGTNMVDQLQYLRVNLNRISTNVDKEIKKVKSLENELVLAECLKQEEGVNFETSVDLQEMLRLLERKIAMVDHRLGDIEKSEAYHGKGKKPLN